MRVALDLANGLDVHRNDKAVEVLRAVLAFDPSSTDVLREADVPGFAALAAELLAVFTALDRDDVDGAAGTVNALLAASPAHPHLAKEDGVWAVHHHPARTDLVSSWTAICAESLARLIGEGYAARGGLCEAEDCRRAFLDTTRNGTRRFCSATCQNRVKAAALRRRRADGSVHAP